MGQVNLLFIYLLFFFTLGTQSPKALNIKMEIYVWNGHGAASEIVNVSTKQTELNLCIYLFIYSRPRELIEYKNNYLRITAKHMVEGKKSTNVLQTKALT